MQNKNAHQQHVNQQTNPKNTNSYFKKFTAERSDKTVTSILWPKIKEGLPKEQRALQNTPHRPDPADQDLDLDLDNKI